MSSTRAATPSAARSSGTPRSRRDTVTATDGSTSVVVTAIGGRNLGRDWFNGKHYLEVRFSGTNGYAIDPATINGDELRLVGPGGAVIVLGSPVRVGTTDVWRYSFSGTLAAGEYNLTFQPGSVRDTGANANQLETERFWLVATSDGLTDLVTEPQIESLVERHPDDAAAEALLNAALAAGGRDNVTCLLATVIAGSEGVAEGTLVGAARDPRNVVDVAAVRMPNTA